MQVQVKKWGNSASVRLPSNILQNAGLKLDDTVDVREQDGCIIIEPVRKPSVSLAALIGAISDDNTHADYFSDDATGIESI